MQCPCNKQLSFNDCCLPIIENDSASDAQTLMRSRYSAYATNNIDYIFTTYSDRRQSEQLRQQLQMDTDQKWLGLVVEQVNATTVTFKAFYSVDSQLHMLQEQSSFVFEQQKWRYDDGIILHSGPTKFARNAYCFCNSGKKYKRCCA